MDAELHFDSAAFVAATLAEDLGEAGDITSAAVIPADSRFTGVMASRDAISVAGLPIAEAFFRALDPDVAIEALVADRPGELRLRAGRRQLRVQGVDPQPCARMRRHDGRGRSVAEHGRRDDVVGVLGRTQV